MDRKVEDVQLGLVQFVDHEPDDLFALLGDHADAVALAEAAEEIFLGPRVLEALLLGVQDFGHVAPDHPADMHADLFLLRLVSAHSDTSPRHGKRAKPPPWWHHASA